MDSIADMLIRMKNAGMAGHESVAMPSSRMKSDIAGVLKKEGFIKDFAIKERRGKKELVLELFLENRVPRIRGARRISKPSKRIYKKHSDLRPVKSGYGLMVLSTPQGVMSGKEAKKANVGGEALFSIW